MSAPLFMDHAEGRPSPAEKLWRSCRRCRGKHHPVKIRAGRAERSSGSAARRRSWVCSAR